LSVKIKDKIKLEYGLLERTNPLWKVLEQIFVSSNNKRSSSNVPENISSSSICFYRDQEEQSSVQKEELESANLGKPDCPVSQTKMSSFCTTEKSLAKEDDCFTTISNVDDDDDDKDDKYHEQKFLVEFKKHISKHMKLQKRHVDVLYFHKELMDSYALLQSAHEVMITKVKYSEPHTCTCTPYSIDLSYANSCCSQAKPSCDLSMFL
jgi:hypothetical protein